MRCKKNDTTNFILNNLIGNGFGKWKNYHPENPCIYDTVFSQPRPKFARDLFIAVCAFSGQFENIQSTHFLPHTYIQTYVGTYINIINTNTLKPTRNWKVKVAFGCCENNNDINFTHRRFAYRRRIQFSE